MKMVIWYGLFRSPWTLMIFPRKRCPFSCRHPHFQTGPKGCFLWQNQVPPFFPLRIMFFSVNGNFGVCGFFHRSWSNPMRSEFWLGLFCLNGIVSWVPYRLRNRMKWVDDKQQKMGDVTRTNATWHVLAEWSYTYTNTCVYILLLLSSLLLLLLSYLLLLLLWLL